MFSGFASILPETSSSLYFWLNLVQVSRDGLQSLIKKNLWGGNNSVRHMPQVAHVPNEELVYAQGQIKRLRVLFFPICVCHHPQDVNYKCKMFHHTRCSGSVRETDVLVTRCPAPKPLTWSVWQFRAIFPVKHVLPESCRSPQSPPAVQLKITSSQNDTESNRSVRRLHSHNNTRERCFACTTGQSECDNTIHRYK